METNDINALIRGAILPKDFNFESLTGMDIVSILLSSRSEELFEYIDFGKLNKYDIVCLIENNPKYIEYCDLSILDFQCQRWILQEHPGLSKYF